MSTLQTLRLQTNWLFSTTLTKIYVHTWFGWVFGIIKDQYITSWSLGSNDARVLRHVTGPVHFSFMVNLDLNLNLATHWSEATKLWKQTRYSFIKHLENMMYTWLISNAFDLTNYIKHSYPLSHCHNARHQTGYHHSAVERWQWPGGFAHQRCGCRGPIGGHCSLSPQACRVEKTTKETSHSAKFSNAFPQPLLLVHCFHLLVNNEI